MASSYKKYQIRHRNPNPKKSVLLVIDMQNHFSTIAKPILPPLTSTINTCRRASIPVIFTRHRHTSPADHGMLGEWWHNDLILDGTPESELMPELPRREEDVVVEKNTYSGFRGTGLEERLKAMGVEEVIVTGVMTNLCCETTAREAFVRGFRVFFSTDATATVTEDLQQATLKNVAYGFGYLVDCKSLQPTPATGSTKKPTRKHKKKQPGEPTASRVGYKPWTENEDVGLARAWIIVSEDPDVSNFQANGIFWFKVYDAWLTITGVSEEHRGKEAVQAHWAVVNGDCQRFAGIFNRLQGAGWRSGHNDADVITQALSDFQAQGKSFKFLKCWETLRHSVKWTGAPTVPVARRVGSSWPSKRSKTSSSTNPSTPNTPSDARNFFVEPVNLDDDEEPSELPRPRGRSRQNTGGGSSSQTNTGPIDDVINDLVGRLETNAMRMDQSLNEPTEHQRMIAISLHLRQMKDDYDFLISSGCHDDAAILEERRLEKMREFYKM